MSYDNNNDKYYLNSDEAQPILDDILRSCHLVPNSLPLDVLQANARTTMNMFRWIRIICTVSIILCFILPFFSFKAGAEFFPGLRFRRADLSGICLQLPVSSEIGGSDFKRNRTSGQ